MAFHANEAVNVFVSLHHQQLCRCQKSRLDPHLTLTASRMRVRNVSVADVWVYPCDV